MHCKIWCPRWNQWHNLSPLIDGCWLQWWHCTGYELSSLAPNKNSQKLWNNNTATKKGQDGYNTSNQFDYIRQWIIRNLDFITNQDELDLCVYEIIWVTDIYSEAGSWLTGQVANNTGLTKVGHIVLVSDVHRVRLHAYRHRNKFHVKPYGWNVWGKIEVKEIM